MNTRTYVLSTDTLAAGAAGIDVFESGPTNLTISMSGVNAHASAGTYHYLKFYVEYSDLDKIYSLQNTSDLYALSSVSITRTFNPGNDFYTTYTIDVSGLRTDLNIDLYRVNFTVSKPPINFYKDCKLVNSFLHTNQTGKDTLLVTVEAEHPNFTGNFYIPYNKSDIVYLPEIPEPFVPNQDRYLRSEMFTVGGGFIPVITERFSSGSTGYDFVLDERQFVEYAITVDNVDQAGGEMISLIGTYDMYQQLDINNEVESPILLIGFEDGIDYSEEFSNDPTFASYFQNTDKNIYITDIFSNGDKNHETSLKFKQLV